MLPAPAYTIVLFVVAAMTTLIALLFVTLLVQRGLATLATEHFRRREAVLRPLLFAALEDRAGVWRLRLALRLLDRRVIRTMLLQLALDLRGDESRVIADLYRELGFLDAELHALSARRAHRRAAAAANLATLRMPAIQRPLIRALDDRDRTVRVALIRAIGEIGDRQALLALVPRLGERSPTVVRQVEQVLIERGREVVLEIVSYAETSQKLRGRRAAVEVLGLLRAPQAADLLLELVRHPDRELRVRAVKAAAAIGDPRFLEAFHELLTDEAWAVRSQAAKGLGALGSMTSVPRLRNALGDDHWWVRFYAAVALAELGEPGHAALRAAEADPEPTVRDMARYLIARGPLLPSLP
jgi:HEAT repeat protein/PBS lyase HEAT-like repeat-containing protein